MDNVRIAFGCVVLFAISIGLIIVLLSSMDDPTKCKECDPLPIWISTNSGIIEINQSDKKAYVLISTESRAVFFDFHFEHKEIFWVEEKQQEVGTSSRIYSLDLRNVNWTSDDGGGGGGGEGLWAQRDLRPRLLAELGPCGGLALDWIHSHMYWIHRDAGVIVEATLDGGHRRVIYEDSDVDIYNIAVDPVRRYLFWTEVWRGNSSLLAPVDVRVSGLAGGSVRTLPLHVVAAGRTLGLDVTERRLYYMERLNTLAMCDYDGGNKAVVLGGLPPYATLTVSSKQLFWSTAGGEVATVVKHSLEAEATFPVLPSLCPHCSPREKVSMFGPRTFLRVVDGRMQPIPDMDHHRYKDCLHNTTQYSDECPCPFGYKTYEVWIHSCIEEGFFLVSAGSELQAVSMQGKTLPLLAKPHTNLSDVDFHFVKSLIFWYDSAESKIFRSPVWNPSRRRPVAVRLPGLSALAVDWTYDNLYWASNTRFGGAVEMSKLDGSYRLEVVPRDRGAQWMSIALEPSEGIMYLANWLAGSVEVFAMDGTPMQRLAEGLSKPHSLTLVFRNRDKQIYWLEVAAGKTIIKGCYLERRQECQVVYASRSVLPFSLTVLGSTVYWIERSELYTFQVDRTRKVRHRKLQLGRKLAAPRSLRLFHSHAHLPATDYCRFRACRGLCVPLPRAWGQTNTRCIARRERFRPPQRDRYASMGL